MNQFLVLRIANPCSWVITGADGSRLGPVATGELADSAPVAKERQVVVIAPGPSVTLARPELPVKSGAKLAQVVPYAMEESLAGEVEQFHFAIGATDESGGTLVAALRRDELRSWLDALAAAGLSPQAIVPDTLCLPENPGKTVAVIDSGLLLVRAPGALPVALDAEPLTESFTLAGLEGDDRHVQLFVSQDDWQRSREMIEALREVTGSLDLQVLPDGALPLLASRAVQGGALSLMQGEFAPRTGWRAEWQRWRVAAILAVAALALHVGARGYDLVRLHAEQSRLEAEIDQAARIALPGVGQITDARAQVEQRLSGGGSADPAGLLGQLSVVAGAMAAAPGPKLQSLGWRDHALELHVTAPSTDVVARLVEGVNAGGLVADVASTTNGEEGIEAKLQVSAGGPAR
jgi:general secretion pathway protein L